MADVRTLDSLILDTAFTHAPLEGDVAGEQYVGARTITVVCDDPTGALTAAALERGTRVLSVDSDYTRAHAAHSAGAMVAGINEPLLIDDFLSTRIPTTGAHGAACLLYTSPSPRDS